MSRLERLREYSNPMKGPHGQSRDKANLDYWSKRAETNSDGADHRATGPVLGGPQGTKDQDLPSLPSTGKRQVSRPTEMAPKEQRKIDALMRGKDDLNHVGESDYLAGIRRTS